MDGTPLFDQWASVESELDLLKLSDEFDDEIFDAGLSKYQQYLNQLDAAKSQLDILLANTAATLDQLAEISASFKLVDKQTKTFQKQSLNILAEQKKNEGIANGIEDNLRYYEPLTQITRRLNTPGAGSFVRSKDFADMLITLDECIDYMQTHPTHKEAESYRSRYKLLLTRALTLVRNTFLAGVKDTTADVTGRLASKQLNDTTMNALLYGKFRVGAADMKDLGLEIQKRANPPADAEPGTEGEYQSLMNELHASFTTCRARLLLPLVQKQLAIISETPSSKDLVQFSRSSIGYIRGVCMDEFDLWGEWFHGHRGLYALLESVCEPLYDHLRPRIIHETKLSKLCALVTLLQTRYLHDEDEDGPADLNQLDFSVLVQPTLQDAQSRLVFRALTILRDEIENYKPKPEDLDYPRRMSDLPKPRAVLSGRRVTKDPTTPLPKTPEVVDEDSADEGSFLWTMKSHDSTLRNCYPTLLKAIRLLSRIYRLVNSSVFDDLAHQIVHQTTVSLHSASAQISAKASPADGQLFLLRHLLLLKSQIVAFDIEYVTPDVSFDFSGFASTFYEIRDRGGLFNPRSWMKLFGTGGLLPRVIENMLDAKVELDGSLRTVIINFTADFATAMTKNLVSSSLEKGTMKKETAEAAAVATRKEVEKEIPILRAKLEQYLYEERTRETLVAAVEDSVVQIYDNFFNRYLTLVESTEQLQVNGNKAGSRPGLLSNKAQNSTAGGGSITSPTTTTTTTGTLTRPGGGMGTRKISRKGKSPEEAVWDIETFSEWAQAMFNVALPQIEEEDDEEDNDDDDDDDAIGMRSASS